MVGSQPRGKSEIRNSEFSLGLGNFLMADSIAWNQVRGVDKKPERKTDKGVRKQYTIMCHSISNELCLSSGLYVSRARQEAYGTRKRETGSSG